MKIENKEEIKCAEQELNSKSTYNHEMKNEEEGGISPFKIYEDIYCNKCEDHRGCLGLIDSMTMALQESKATTGNEAVDGMIKNMGGLTFSTRFKIILDCAHLRDIISKINVQNLGDPI